MASHANSMVFTYKGFTDMDDVQQEPQVIEEDQISASATEESDVSSGGTDTPPQDEAPQEDKVVFDERQQAKVNSLIGEKVAKLHGANREADELRAKLAEIEASQPKPVAPEIPPLPDPDDYFGDTEGYNAEMAKRDKAIAESAEFNAKQTVIDDHNKRESQRQEMERFEGQQKSIAGYAESAKSFGIDPQKMQQEAATVSQFLASPELDDFVVNDPQGPLVTSYLASNVLELDKIKSMSPPQAAVYIATQIKPKLASAGKQSTAPNPPDVIDGGGAPEKVHPSLVGAVFK